MIAGDVTHGWEISLRTPNLRRDTPARNYMICTTTKYVCYGKTGFVLVNPTDMANKSICEYQVSSIPHPAEFSCTDPVIMATLSATLSGQMGFDTPTAHGIGQLYVILLICLGVIMVYCGFFLGSYIYRK